MSALSLGRTPALLIVDMQNSFCHAEGHRGALGMDHSAEAAVIAPVARLLGAARAAAIPVFFSVYALKADYSDAGLLTHRWPGIKETGSLIAGTWSAEIVPELRPRPEETVIVKTRHSAFFGTDLGAALKHRGADTLIVCGVTTNVCVEGTARDAFALDLHVVVPGDGTAAPTREMHERGLANIAFALGVVTTVEDVVAALTDGPADAPGTPRGPEPTFRGGIGGPRSAATGANASRGSR